MRSRFRFSLMLVPLLLTMLLGSLPSSVQAAPRCFQETGQCLDGRFRAYWEQHGGLPVFGYPITPARMELNRDTGRVYLTQWFERNRFELHPENQPPYDVLLGRLGDDFLQQQGRSWPDFPKASPSAPHYFPQTGHAVAEVFWGYWSAHGLEFDGRPGKSAHESLALFGYPISEPAMERNSSGDTVLTQHFERARFEHHPNNPDPYKVLLGRLGSEVHALRPAQPQMRALWVDAFHDGFRTPEQVRQLISDAQRGNLNTLIVQVRRRGDAFYHGGLEPLAETGDEPAPVPAGFDPLQALIDQAHPLGIEVHAWIAALPVWHSDARYQTADPRHVWRRHGPDAPGSDNWAMLRLRPDGSLASTYSLDPGHPDAARYTVDVALDLVRRYDIDGVHLDYIRYGGRDEGYNPVAVARFNQQFGRSGMPAPTDAEWLQWRRDQVSDLVRRLYVESYALKPRVKISAAVITWGAGPVREADWVRTSAYAQVLQDWRAWTEEGIIDIGFPMNYYREFNAADRASYDQWVAWQQSHQYGRHILAGPGIFLNYIEDSLAQIQRALAPSGSGQALPGVALYSYAASSLDTNSDYRGNATAQRSLPRQPWEYRPELRSTFFTALSSPTTYTYRNQGQVHTAHTTPVFSEPAPLPSMRWKQTPANGLLSGQIRPSPAAPSAHDGLRIQLQGPVSRVLRSDGNGWFGAVELPPGHYQVSVTDRAGRVSTLQTTIEAGRVARIEVLLQP